jgi:hypothetical protein
MPKPRKKTLQATAESRWPRDAAYARSRAAGTPKTKVIPSMRPIASSLAGAKVARATPPAQDLGRSIRQAAAFSAAVPYAAAQLVRNAVAPPKPKAIDTSSAAKPKPIGLVRKTRGGSAKLQ